MTMAGHLTQLVCWMPGWIAQTLTHTELKLGGASPYSYQKTEDLLAMFDKNVNDAREAIRNTPDADYDVEWSLKFGDRTVMTQPRGDVVRSEGPTGASAKFLPVRKS